jgi:electron transfer flavoprotein alpha subunit
MESVDRDVWVLLEAADAKLESYSLALMDEGKRLSAVLGGRLCAVGLGPRIENIEEIAGRHGVTHLFYAARKHLDHYEPEVFETLISGLLAEHTPRLFLSTTSSLGSDLMPRLAAKLKAPLVTNCVEIRIEENIEFLKPVQNGRLHAAVVCKTHGTRMATMSPEALPPHQEITRPQVLEMTEFGSAVGEGCPRICFKNRVKADHRTIDIGEAEFVLAIGRGIGPIDRLPIYTALADRIGGAIGVTRPVVDEGMFPFDRQIGQTGKDISPRLLIMCGISGAMEFTKGAERARTKIAINKDRKAPIFRGVDLGIVEDLNTLIPQLIDHIDRRSRENG